MYIFDFFALDVASDEVRNHVTNLLCNMKIFKLSHRCTTLHEAYKAHYLQNCFYTQNQRGQ